MQGHICAFTIYYTFLFSGFCATNACVSVFSDVCNYDLDMAYYVMHSPTVLHAVV